MLQSKIDFLKFFNNMQLKEMWLTEFATLRCIYPLKPAYIILGD